MNIFISISLHRSGEANRGTPFDFNGVDQYATFPEYTTYGDPDVYFTSTAQPGFIGTPPVSEFGRIGGAYYDGPGVAFTIRDTSPLQGVSVNFGESATFPSIRPQAATVTVSFIYKTGDQVILSGTVDVLSVVSDELIVPTYVYGDDLFNLTLDGIAYDEESPPTLVDGRHYAISFQTSFLYSDEITTAGPFPAGGGIGQLQVVQTESPLRTWDFGLDEGSGTTINNSDATTKYLRNIENLQLQSNNITSPVQGPPIDPDPPTGDDWPEEPNANAVLLYTIDGETGAAQDREAIWDGGSLFPPTSYVSPACVGITTAATRNGTKAWYSRQRASDFINNPNLPAGYHPRAQFSKPIQTLNGRFNQEQDYWTGFSVYFPSSNWTWPTLANKGGGMIFEFKGVGGSNVQFPMALLVSPDEAGNPALHIDNKQGGEFLVDWVQAELWTWADDYTGTVPPYDTWIDFIFNFKISLGATGYVKTWCRNNAETTPVLKQIIDYSGPTTYWGSDGKPPSTSDGWCLIAGHYAPGLLQATGGCEDQLMYFDEWRAAKNALGGGPMVDPKYAGGTHP